MALSFLFRRLQKGHSTKDPFHLQAFVVDHKVREGSTDEVKAVVASLERMGKTSHIYIVKALLLADGRQEYHRQY